MSADVAVPDARRALRRWALLCALLMAVVVVASAALRHLGASVALQAAWADELVWLRWVHRLAATGVLLGALALLVLAWRGRRTGPAGASMLLGAAALVGLALLLSAVGVAGGASRAAPVVLVNLVGGFTMLALCAWLARDPGPARLGRPARWVGALVLLQAAAGAVAAAQAAPDCDAWVGCVAAAWVHRGLGLGLALALSALGLWAASRRGHPAGAALAVLGAGLLVLGVMAALLGAAAPPGLALLHNAVAAAALALLVRET
jgi:heme A synthase